MRAKNPDGNFLSLTEWITQQQTLFARLFLSLLLFLHYVLSQFHKQAVVPILFPDGWLCSEEGLEYFINIF